MCILYFNTVKSKFLILPSNPISPPNLSSSFSHLRTQNHTPAIQVFTSSLRWILVLSFPSPLSHHIQSTRKLSTLPPKHSSNVPTSCQLNYHHQPRISYSHEFLKQPFDSSPSFFPNQQPPKSAVFT